MNESMRSCFYFPTTVLLIDDCRAFIENISLSLDKNLSFKFVSDPVQALEFLKNEENLTTVKKSFFNTFNEDEGSEEEIRKIINFKNITNFLYNPNRFSYVTTLLLDYNMPNITGTELSKKLVEIQKSYKIIMLTGEATYDTAIEVFNEKLIDKFIVKGSKNMMRQVNSSIKWAQEKYFSEVNNVLADMLMLNNEFIFSSKFKELFNKIHLDGNFVEYYLLDCFGSFVFFDINANPTWLIIRPKKELLHYLEIAKDNGAGDSLQLSLASREVMPIFLSGTDFETPICQWEKKLFPCKKVNESEYYYSLIHGYEVGNLCKDKIKSYKDYLNEMKVEI